ncbi:Rieske 2Fe-2S domain-containing protein [Sinimarinibacterium sp. NLF-5-8]|uniref:Rieske 2Fe-2S domain-containing protein n=1 Tax=Sinimarinibacterium sp. NLF-5-8 TaxID=2698684 RepID=UPI00137BFA53|nr:Rieske 2Fe-2S domain-containing protein [Sinimarinibacterium sp. NLF-5-8]QHS11106.1 Rieske 2Fe-2S domain-containing protein [Sinimarinibacterium sp. NLF-5-8]
MTFEKACSLDDVWEGEMIEVDVGGHVVLLVGMKGGEVKAFQGMCPHQDIPLCEGKFDGCTLMCKAHQWTFEMATGKGINPGDCRLASYPVRIEGDDVLVDVDGVKPLFAHS